MYNTNYNMAFFTGKVDLKQTLEWDYINSNSTMSMFTGGFLL